MASRSLNRVQLLGRLGKDSETKFTPSGAAVTKFSVATDRNYKQGEEWKNETTWTNVVVWKAENLANYLLKGTQIYLEGRLSTRSYDDKDGKKVWVVEVVAEARDVILLGGNKDGGREPQRASGPRDEWNDPVAQPHASGQVVTGVTEEDLPF